jgi:hypothetical protein
VFDDFVVSLAEAVEFGEGKSPPSRSAIALWSNQCRERGFTRTVLPPGLMVLSATLRWMGSSCSVIKTLRGWAFRWWGKKWKEAVSRASASGRGGEVGGENSIIARDIPVPAAEKIPQGIETPQLPSPDKVPEGLGKSDRHSIRIAHETREHSLQKLDSDHHSATQKIFNPL